jgi:hypothetical protein
VNAAAALEKAPPLFCQAVPGTIVWCLAPRLSFNTYFTVFPRCRGAMQRAVMI